MKIFAWISSVLLAVLLVFLTILAFQLHGLSNTITSQQKQISQQKKSLQTTSAANQVTSLRNQVALLSAQLSGEHKDVITCLDLSNMGLQDTYGVTVDNQGNVNLNQLPVTLPSHCLNR